MKSKAIIVDIDGTIANCLHRRHFLEEKNPDWRSFNESCVTDTLNPWCREIVEHFKSDHTILFVSGRAEEYREVTEKWLDDNKVCCHFLFMRKNKDYRDDTIIKKEIYESKIAQEYEVTFVIDDRSKMVDMWRKLGLICLQCDEGNY